MRRKLITEVDSLSAIYPPKIRETVREHLKLLEPIQDLWQLAFEKALLGYGITRAANVPNLLQEQSLASVRLPKAKRYVLGFCGPGATGKETVAKALGAPKVINTTTRAPRSYETNGVEYWFVDETTFRDMRAANSFVFSHEKIGRGWYGVQKADLNSVLGSSSLAIVEESPTTLQQLQTGIQQDFPDTVFLAIYLLPPSPVLANLACRLAKRCLGAGDPYKPVVISTLGPRQVEEFESTIDLRSQKVPLIYIVNDDVEAAVGRIRSIL